ncbi:RHS repeat-associated protein, partial [Epilithonimonas hungarica]|uniref:RHS repeat-associated core domain-containing protein n=1 Tax=Epilithonimonas hungarica TaxID=454006 RepID=UPI0027838678
NYKFGGKELQESGMYDFGARNYMPDVGRWFGADPLAELAPDLSPYRYAFNNPISFTDPTGMYEGDGGGDWDEENDRPEGDYGRSNPNPDKGLFSWTENARNNEESDINIFEKSVLILLDIINGDFRVNLDNLNIRSGGDGRSESDFMADISYENGFGLDEKPVNLFGPNEKSTAPHGVVNSRSYNENDGKFTVFGHGSPGVIQDGNTLDIINSAKGFDEMMNKYSPNWDAAKDKKGTVLALWLCNSATGGQSFNSFAQEISIAHPNITVIGADGFLNYERTVSDKFRIGSSDRVKNSGDKKGDVVTYQNGVEVSRRRFTK